MVMSRMIFKTTEMSQINFKINYEKRRKQYRKSKCPTPGLPNVPNEIKPTIIMEGIELWIFQREIKIAGRKK